MTRSVDDNESGVPVNKRYRQEVLDHQRRYKREIASHEDIIKLLTKFLLEPLRVRKEREDAKRSESSSGDRAAEDAKRIEREKLDNGDLDNNALLTLYLLNNLILIPDEPADPAPATLLISAMEESGTFEVTRGISQQLNSERYSSKYSAYVFPLLEFYYALFGMIAPELVVKAWDARQTSRLSISSSKSKSQPLQPQEPAANDPLVTLRANERRNKQLQGGGAPTGRHPKFTGSYVVNHKNTRQVLNNAFHVKNPEDYISTASKRKPQRTKRKKQESSVCPGGMVNYLEPNALGQYELEAMAVGKDPRFEILTVLYRAADSFLSDENNEVDEEGFAPVTSCYAHLIRACAKTIAYGSGVNERDRIRFLRVMAFGIGFSRWQSMRATIEKEFQPGDVRVTLDRFTFTVVLTAIENYRTWKQFDGFKVALNTLKEMIALLCALFFSERPVSQTLAFALESSVLGEREVIDSIPLALRQWDHEKSDKDYEGILVELCYYIRKTARKLVERGTLVSKKRKNKSNDNERENSDKASREKKRQEKVSMDMNEYLKQFVHNNVVRLHIRALWRYETNEARTNDHIIDFLKQLANFQVTSKSCAPSFSCEPMLWHVSFVNLIHHVLSDTSVTYDHRYSELVDFLKRQTRHMLRSLKGQPLLMAEMLFWRDKQVNKLINNNYKPLELLEKPEKKKTKAQLAREEAEREAELNKLAKEAEDSEFEFSEDNAADLDSGMIVDPQAVKKKKPSKKKWTENEDSRLKELYKKFNDLENCFEMIASDELFVEMKKSKNQLRQRARKLGLIGSKGKTKKSKRQRNTQFTIFNLEEFRKIIDVLREDTNFVWLPFKNWLVEQLRNILLVAQVKVGDVEEAERDENTEVWMDRYTSSLGVELSIVPLLTEHFEWLGNGQVQELLQSMGFSEGDWLMACSPLVPVNHLLKCYQILVQDMHVTEGSQRKTKRISHMIIEDSDSD